MLSRPFRLLGVPLVLAAALTPFVPADAQDAPVPARTFDAVTSGSGFDLTISNPSIPAGITIQGSGPIAQAKLTSLGEASGFASFPYPGDTVANITGLASAVFLAGFPIPPYPLIASSNAASGSQAVNFPGIALRSDSASTRSTAAAVVGTDGSGYSANAKVVVNDDGTVTATSTARFSAAQLGGVLSIDGVESTATSTLEADGTVSSESSISAATIRVPGLHLTIPPSTPPQAALPIPIPGLPQLPVIPLPALPIPLGGTTIDTPEIGFVDGQFTLSIPFLGSQKFAIPAQPVLDALKAAGVTVTYQAPIKTDTGIVSAVLTLETVIPAPPENPGFNGPTPVKIALGRSSASIQATAAGTATPAVDLGASLGADGGLGSSLGSSGFDVPSIGSGDAPVLPAPIATDSGAARPSTVLAAHLSPRASIFDIYLVLVGIGLAGTLASQVIRYVGVRSSWS